jgi:cell division protein FtsQ
MIGSRARSANGKKGQPRARVVPMWRTRRALVVWAGLLVAACVGTGWLAWNAGIPQRTATSAVESMVAASARLGFVVRDVFVVGRGETPKRTLLEALAVKRGAPILSVDLEEARQRVQALPWVRHASVRRVLPDTLIVEIVERRPLALWQHEKKFALIDEEGQVILRDDVGPFSRLMVVVGEDAPANAAVLVRMLASEPELLPRVTAAVRVGGRRWNVHLADGIDVKLPEQDPERAWRRLADYQRQHRLLDKPVRVLDLRLEDRLVVRPAESRRETGSDA